MTSRAGLLSAALLLCFTRLSYAGSSSSSPLGLEFDSQLGWIQGQHSGGVDEGATVRLRYRVVTAGVGFQGATNLFGIMGSFSTVAGLSIPIELVRLDALAEFGVNGYTGVGSNFLSQDPGASAAIPFVGARTSLLARVLRNGRGFSIWLGPSVQYASDLYSATRTYNYRDKHSDWFTGNSTDELVTRTVRIGQSRWSFLATMSMSLPL